MFSIKFLAYGQSHVMLTDADKIQQSDQSYERVKKISKIEFELTKNGSDRIIHQFELI